MNQLFLCLEGIKNGIEDNTHKIWSLVCLEIWFKNNYD